MQRTVFFSFLAAILTMNLIFILVSTRTIPGEGIVEPVAPSLNKTASIQTPNGSAIDFWEYRATNLSCLISVHVYTTQGSFTQISCTK